MQLKPSYHRPSPALVAAAEAAAAASKPQPDPNSVTARLSRARREAAEKARREYWQAVRAAAAGEDIPLPKLDQILEAHKADDATFAKDVGDVQRCHELERKNVDPEHTVAELRAAMAVRNKHDTEAQAAQVAARERGEALEREVVRKRHAHDAAQLAQRELERLRHSIQEREAPDAAAAATEKNRRVREIVHRMTELAKERLEVSSFLVQPLSDPEGARSMQEHFDKRYPPLVAEFDKLRGELIELGGKWKFPGLTGPGSAVEELKALEVL